MSNHPFEVFPEELWPVIVEKLEDSSQILKVIQAIPEIEPVMESRKRWWLFDQVIPLVSHWMEDEDILSCRQVCKQWSQAVDSFLDNHPRFRAYSHEQVTGQEWVHDGQPAILTSWNYISRRICLNNRAKIAHFMKYLEGRPTRRNPVVGRSLAVNSQHDIEVLTGGSEVFSRIGRHIWYLSLEDYRHTEPLPFCRSLMEWIGQLPNLKGLRLQFRCRERALELDGADEEFGNSSTEDEDEDDDYDQVVGVAARPEPDEAEKEEEEVELTELEEFLNSCKESLPPLPQLETLEIHFDCFPPILLQALLTSYSLQIRRLWLPLRYWSQEYNSLFPNLTELTIEFIPSTERMTELLLSIQAPLLYDLSLWLKESCQLAIDTDIFPWLKRFPLLRNLSMMCDAGPIYLSGDLSPSENLIPSLKYVAIPEEFLQMNSNFLLCFPNLEYADLGDSIDIFEEGPLEPTLKIWKQIQDLRLYESNVWELLPKLQGISVWDLERDSQIHFNRETYEYRKKIVDEKANE